MCNFVKNTVSSHGMDMNSYFVKVYLKYVMQKQFVCI